jgi:hypothetical protein
MSILGDAIQQALKPWRINYSIYGNTDNFLHAHVWELEERRVKPVWLYPKEMWSESEYSYTDKNHGELRRIITNNLNRLIDSAY